MNEGNKSTTDLKLHIKNDYCRLNIRIIEIYILN